MSSVKTTKPPFDSALVITHIICRTAPPFDPLEGPYSSVGEALKTSGVSVTTLQIPLNSFSNPVLFGNSTYEKKLKIPTIFGVFLPLKYLTDIFIVLAAVLIYWLRNRQKKLLVVGIDPLTCLPLAIVQKLCGYFLAFYSVDFNLHRFKNTFFQSCYEKADEISSKLANQTWVVCESLKRYKKEHYGISAIYIPNSSLFDNNLYEKNKKLKTGKKVVWGGSLLTDHQFDILFSLLEKLQRERSELEFYFAPTGKHERFGQYAKQYRLTKWKVLHLTSRRKWQQFVAGCDLGIAVYDPDFGSTEFIEPLKIWDYLMGGVPFIISSEPSLSNAIKQSGTAYILGPRNAISDKNSLRNFLKVDNLFHLQSKCVALAKKYDIRTQINAALKNQ